MKRFVSFVVVLLLLTGGLLPRLASRVRADPANLMANPSVETLDSSGIPVNWTPETWGTSDTVLSTTSDAQDGSTAITINTTTRTDGDAKWMPDPVAVTGGQTYTYTDYSKATVPTQLDAVYTDASGNVTYNYLATVQPSSSWQENTADLTVPTNEVKVAVWHILSAVGVLTTDDFSLTLQQATVPPPDGNLISNPSMETADGSVPAGWQTDNWGTNTANFSYVTDGGHTGSASAKVQISSYTDGDAKWYFTPVSVQPNSSYSFSDYYMATTDSALVVRFDDGNGNYTYAEPSDPAPVDNWTQTDVSFTTPANAKYVTVFHLIRSVGTLQTDDASLTLDVPPTGNLITNPSLETANGTEPAGWENGSWGTNTANFSYVTDGGHTGSAAVNVQISSFSSGAAYWYPADAQPITGGQLYDFTDYYKSDIPSELDATITMADGSQQDIYLGSAFASPNSWTKFETQFTPPTGATTITIYHDIYAVGYLTTDDYSLTSFTYQGFTRPIVSITDDDGFGNFYTNGLPVLQKYDLPATAYIVSGYINAPDYMSATQIQGLATDNIEVGSHSVDHADLSTLSASDQVTELQGSQATLQNLLGMPVTDYAAPYGAYNQQIVSTAQNYYQTYRGTMSGYNAKNNFDPMNLSVQNITSATKVADVEGWLQEAAATHTWLILVYHEIATNPADTTYNTLPSDFDAQMSAVKNSGIAVETVSQALAEITPQL